MDESQVNYVEKWERVNGRMILVRMTVEEAEALKIARIERAKKTRRWRKWIKQKEQKFIGENENIPAWGFKNFYCRKHQFYGPSCEWCMELNGVCDYAGVFRCNWGLNFNPCPICDRKNTDACKDCRKDIVNELFDK